MNTVEIEIKKVILNDSLTIKDISLIKELFDLRMPQNGVHFVHVPRRAKSWTSWQKFDVASKSRIKEIVCTYKERFLKGFRTNDPRTTWVKPPEHFITSTLLYLFKSPTIDIVFGDNIYHYPCKFRYFRDTKSLFIYK